MTTVVFPLLHSHLLLKRLILQNPSTGPAHHLLLLAGETIHCRNDTDRELPFRQESNFFWLSGCEVPGSALSVSIEYEGGEVDVDKVESRLWLPEVNPEEVMWSGLPPSPAHLATSLNHTSVTAGWTPTTLSLLKPTRNPNLKTYIHTLPVSPFKQFVATINGPIYTSYYLQKALHEARRNKTDWEIETMKEAARITSEAHRFLMESIGKGEVRDEGEAEGCFVGFCRKFGAKHQAYTPIMASGTSAGTLHYVANDAPFPSGITGSLLLVDAGAEYKNYAGDVTRCIPLGNGGKFTKECREVYELVLEMQEAAFTQIKPGENWESIQLLMHTVAARGLLKLGILTPGSLVGKTEDEIVDKIVGEGITRGFFPHGVGHLLGLDVHDVGGLPEGKSKNPLLKYLRLRVPLEEGFVVTVEPGIYFNSYLLAEFSNSEFINKDVLERYFYVGGVRIEDNVLVTKDGFENFTTAPKAVEEVEALTSTFAR